MSGRRVVIVLPEPPLPFGGAAARWYHVLLDALGRVSARAIVLAACPPAELDAARTALARAPLEVRLYPHDRRHGLRRRLATLRRPFSYVHGPELVAELTRQVDEVGCDVVHIEHPWGLWLADRWLDRTVVSVHHLYSIDLASDPTHGALNHVRRWSTLRAERALLRRARHITPLTPRLAEHVRSWNHTASIAVVPMALDLRLYDFAPAQVATAPVLTLIGTFGWSPTRQAAERLVHRLWPGVRRLVPTARLRLVGRGANALPQHVRTAPGVEIESDVPDTRAHFHAAQVLLYSPARGSGMKVKVMEAMALGTAVVTNDEGAEGLGARDGVELLIRTDDEALISATASLLTDEQRRFDQARAARALLERSCDPATVAARVEACHAHVVKGPS